jgi:hypothetical protein
LLRKSLCTQLVVYKIIGIILLQIIVHTSCMYKFCTHQTYTHKLSDKNL